MMMNMGVRQVAQLVAQDARDRTDAGHVRLVADVLAQQTIADLPRENTGILLLQLSDVVDHLRGGHSRLRPSDGTGKN